MLHDAREVPLNTRQHCVADFFSYNGLALPYITVYYGVEYDRITYFHFLKINKKTPGGLFMEAPLESL